MARVSIIILAVLVVAGTITSSDGREMVRSYNGHTTHHDHPQYHILTPVSLGGDVTRGKRQALVMDQPIRITTVFADDFDTNLQATKSGLVRNEILPKLLTFLQDSLSVSQTAGPILINNACTDGFFLRDPTTGNIMCAKQCAPITSCGTFQVPTQHLKACFECNAEDPRSVDVSQCLRRGLSTDGSGVADTDFLLYVTANQSACPEATASAQTVAFALACQTEVTQDRPVAGVVNFCPNGLQNRDADFAFALIKHEILHALAFAYSLFPLWRDPSNNQPRTERSSQSGLPIQDISSTVNTVTYNDWQTASGLVQHSVTRLVTPAVVDEARAHFGCSTLDGLALENQGGSGTMLNHWEKRLLGNEGMTGQLTFNPVFSRITFAVLEDSGWYRVNYSLAEELIWGRGAGCRFVEGSCGEWMTTQGNNDQQQSLSPFCNSLESDGSSLMLGCTVDREAVARCNRVTYQSLPSEYQYFPGSLGDGGRISIADYCPLQDVFRFNVLGGSTRGTICSNANDSPPSNSFQEVYGAGSRCVNHGNQWTINGAPASTIYGSGCYRYVCSEDQINITIASQEITCECSQAGNEVTVDVTVSGSRYQGSILCPPCVEICHDSRSIISDDTVLTVPTAPTTTNHAVAMVSQAFILPLAVMTSLSSLRYIT